MYENAAGVGLPRWRAIAVGGALAGIAVAAVAYVTLAGMSPAAAQPDASERIATVLALSVWPALLLFALTVMVGLTRFVTGSVVPDRPGEPRSLRVGVRVLTNTLEQTVVLVLLLLALAATGSDRVDPAAAVAVFVGARIVFLLGYLVHPLARAPGMAATFTVNGALAVEAAIEAIASA